jgi:hypothetical protein
MSVSFDAPSTSTTSAKGSNFSVDVEFPTPVAVSRLKVDAVGESFADGIAVYRESKREPVRLGMDLSWHTDGEPFHYVSTSRYEIPCLVEGTVQLGDRTVTVKGQGQRDHSWGERDWWSVGWCWMAARLSDGTRVHAVDVRFPDLNVAFGYVQGKRGTLEVLTSAKVTEQLGPEGLPTRCTSDLNDGLLDLAIEPLAFGPLVFVSPDGLVTKFPRAMARFSDPGGRTGLGWIEWNQPQTD